LLSVHELSDITVAL